MFVICTSLFAAILSLSQAESQFGECGSAEWNQPEIVISTVSGQNRDSTMQPIRLTFVYQDLDEQSDDERDYFENVIMGSAKGFLEKALLVYPIIGNLVLEGLKTCGDEIDVPEEHRTEGLEDTDLVVYVTAHSKPEESYVAYAGACMIQGGGFNNVLAGRIAINYPHYDSINEEMKISMITHEITHILGFSDSLFPFYHKPNGDPYLADELLVVDDVRGLPRYIVTTPSVQAAARKAFGCDTALGMELENGGGDGTAGSHWEMRLAFHDYMAGQVTPDTLYTTFTFGLLKDSGWYGINWDYIQEPAFGYQAGCEFIDDYCVEDAESNFEEFFCAEVRDSCDMFHLQKGYCDVKLHEEGLEEAYQYFADPHIGGKNKYRDFCPVIREYSGGSCRGLGEEPTVINNLYGEIVCANCRCLEGTLLREEVDTQEDPYHSGCYEVVKCYREHADIRVGNDISGYEIVQCSFQGGVVEVPGYSGYLVCPDSNVLCGNVPCIDNCHGKGMCVNGQCECDPGYGGPSCAIQCHSDCLTCTGPGSLECVTCAGAHTMLNYDGTCGCQLNYTPVSDECVCVYGFVGADGACYENCGKLCIDCNIEQNACEECTEHASPFYSKCVCDEGYQESDGECVPVVSFLSLI